MYFLNKIKIITGFLSSVVIVARQNELFSLEKKRQKENVGRLDKIEVRYLGIPNDVTLIMNKGLSTPFNCAQRKIQILILNKNILYS